MPRSGLFIYRDVLRHLAAPAWWYHQMHWLPPVVWMQCVLVSAFAALLPHLVPPSAAPPLLRINTSDLQQLIQEPCLPVTPQNAHTLPHSLLALQGAPTSGRYTTAKHHGSGLCAACIAERGQWACFANPSYERARVPGNVQETYNVRSKLCAVDQAVPFWKHVGATMSDLSGASVMQTYLSHSEAAAFQLATDFLQGRTSCERWDFDQLKGA